MTREELRDYVEEQRNLDIIPYHVYSALIDSIDTLELQPEDAISRQAAIDIASGFCHPANVVKELKRLPSVQPKYNASEWCHDCKEYDQDKHCCPRFNKVIRNTVEEIKQPKTHWISYWDEEARCYVYKCPECGNKQPFDAKHCWECGARLDVPDMNDGKLSEISTGSESEKT